MNRYFAMYLSICVLIMVVAVMSIRAWSTSNRDEVRKACFERGGEALFDPGQRYVGCLRPGTIIRDSITKETRTWS
jgi:hypothetical protein